MHELAPLIKDLAVMLGVASIVTLLFQRIRQPVVLGYLVAGLIIGPYSPPYSFISDVPNIKIISELGVIFLMFSLGLTFSFHKLSRVGFSAGMTGLFEVIAMTGLGFFAGKLLGWSFNDCLFLGAALAISSTTIIIKAMDELGLMKKRFSELIFGILVVEDLLAILLLVVLQTIVLAKDAVPFELALSAGKLILVVGSWFIAGYFLIPTLLRRIMSYASEETLTIVSVGLCLFLVTVAAQFKYSTALGAFIMGSILAETPFIHRIENLIKPIRDIFAAVFFISVGMLINPQIIIQHWAIILILTLLTIFGKLLTTGLGALLTGQSLNTSIRVGFSMAQVGEFSFIIAALGVALSATSDSIYPIIVAVSGITTFTTPYLIRFSGKLAIKLDNDLPQSTKFFLNRYSAMIYRYLSGSERSPLMRGTISRLLINAIIIAVIFTLIHEYVLPYSETLTTKIWLVNAICWLIALVLSSPFIWGMLFAYQPIHPERNKRYFDLLTLIIWILVITEITILSIFYFYAWFIVIVFSFLFLLLFIFSYQQLEKTYYWLEGRFVENIQPKHSRFKRYEELAPWDTHFVEITVSNHSALAGKTLSEANLQETFGVIVVAIYRSGGTITAIHSNEKILAQDRLIVLGNDEQIDMLRKQLEQIYGGEEEGEDLLDNFVLKATLLETDNPLVGKTIRAAKKDTQGLIVGLERDETRILNPNPTTVLRAGDLVFSVSRED